MFCKPLKSKLRKALQAFDQYVQQHVDTALKITTALKDVLKSPVGDIITAIIPGDIDAVIRIKAIGILSTAVDALGIVKNCEACTDMNKKLQCFIDGIKTVDPALQNALLIKLASLLTAGLDDNKLADSLYDLYVQAKFVASKK